MYANPEMVDKPGVVHDQVKAEHMARAANASMDKAVMAKKESARSKHEAEAQRQMDQVATEYDADPLGAPTALPKKSLFSWLRR